MGYKIIYCVDCGEEATALRSIPTDEIDNECHHCGSVEWQDDEPEMDEHDIPDNEADAMTLASAGWGTDEDYGYFGGDD